MEAKQSYGNRFLDDDDLMELLREEEDIIEEKSRESIIGYPTRPLYRELGSQLQQWLDTGEETIKEIGPCLKRIKSLFPIWSNDELIYTIRDILVKLGKRGLLDLLGMRKTVGSCSIWPPPRKILEQTFCEKHSPETDSILSVGARALAKHCHRDATLSWWGNCTGSEKAKSDHASKKMKEILDNATWLNIHLLPHDVKILEARQENGYGARWTSDGRQFRGFVEPQMVDGHEVGWKH